MERTTSVSRWRSWPASLLRSPTTEQQLWWKSVGCAPATVRRRAHGTCHPWHCIASCTSELGKTALCIRISQLEPVHYKEKKMNNKRNKGVCALTLPLPPRLFGGEPGGFAYRFTGNTANVKVLPTHPVTVQIQTTVTKERFCWGCRIREIKIFIGKAGRDKGTHGNYFHYHNDKHKQPVP